MAFSIYLKRKKKEITARMRALTYMCVEVEYGGDITFSKATYAHKREILFRSRFILLFELYYGFFLFIC